MEIAKITSIIYLAICIIIPIIYLAMYHFRKSKRKNYGKAFLIAFVMFIILFSFKLLFSLNVGAFDQIDCYINNNCDDINYEEKEMKKTTKKTATTTTTTTTTSKTTTTTKKIAKSYGKVSEISGTKTDKGKTSKGFSIYEIDGVTYIDGYLIANKSYFLPETFVPTNTHTKADGNATRQCSTCIDKLAYKAYQAMDADAAAVGLNLYISSGFRSFITQSNIYNRNVKNNGQAKADTYSARPGSSEHQTGLAFDLNTIDAAFGRSAEGKWVNQNCHKYGFIIRYPEGKTDETGYIYESWHLRYVGTDLSYKLYNDGDWLTMEDYFGITSKYDE